ncbi:MAG: hypothetical protein GC154_04205 [bacterium]|nr:hypothetical protein [bacterium]
MKEIIINDYLRKNPDIKRHEIVTKTVNGRVIVETITNTFNKLSERNRPKNALSNKEKKLLKHLADGGDSRYAASLESISTSRKYIDWLAGSTFTGFSESDKEENTQFVEKREVDAGRRAQELLYVRKKFTDQMSSTTKPSRSLIQTLMMEYISAVMRQLKVQAQVFGKEIELGNLFSDNVKRFLRDNFDKLEKASEKIIATVGKAIKILQKGAPKPLDVKGKEDHKKVQALLDDQNKDLTVRREEYDMIIQLIAYLEKLIGDMGKVATEPDAPAPKVDNSSRRMAFHSKKGRDRR